MTELPFFQVDAFADRPFAGNPAAVMPLEAWLADEVLQAIALENNLSETAFTVAASGEDADYELRWFTPQSEVALCGHATLAAGHVLLRGEQVRFATRCSGVLEVRRDGEERIVSLPAMKAVPKPLPRVVAALGASPTDTLWHDGRYAIAVFNDEVDILALRPDFRRLAAEGDVLTIATAPGRDSDMVSRVFAPGVGIDEDPVTGSAHALLVPYWAERLGRAELTAVQASARGGRLTGRLAGDRVLLGGRCATVIEGTFFLS